MKTHTDITIILDRSGSMNSIKQATIDGFNSFIKEHQTLSSTVKLTLVQFDHEYEIVYQNKNIKKVNCLNDSTFHPRGTTALLDAIGKSIDHNKKYFKALDASKRPKNVIIAVITDGFENASELYSRNDIFKKIDKQKKKDNWTFVFIGANQDAIVEGAKFGFSKEQCLSMKASKIGVNHAFNSFIKQSKRKIIRDKYAMKFSQSDREKQKD